MKAESGKSSPVRAVKTGPIIELEVWMHDPDRLVYEYWSEIGALLAKRDPFNPVTNRMEDIYGNKL